MIKIRKGLALPIAGAPAAGIEEGRAIRSVAVLGDDYPGMKPTMAVAEGDRVVLGQTLFTDKKNEGVCYTAPGAGRVTQINRGAKRALLSVVIDLEGDEAQTFAQASGSAITALSRQALVENLVDSGLWTSLRTRPFSKVPAIDAKPQALFINAMDSNPLAADPKVIIAEQPEAFADGVELLSKLTDGKVYLCHKEGDVPPVRQSEELQLEAFGGIHPAGLTGTHIHFLNPVGMAKTVWSVGYQDVIAVGQLFASGRLPTSRVVALAGPGVRNPRLLRTRLGASIDELTAGELADGHQRAISGSVLAGRQAEGPVAYLGRYHQQVSVLPEDNERRLLGYLSPGLDKHSVFPIYLSKWFGKKEVSFSTTTNGSPRGMVPIGTYESVMPLDILPTQLLRSLLVGDIESAIGLGCLELDEEDLALCTYACPGKYEFGPVLRDMLTQIEKEG
ncbi:MAG: Na(+)-translocating NADH-quinone reductase subunit A [Pseudomonadales bacterium]